MGGRGQRSEGALYTVEVWGRENEKEKKRGRERKEREGYRR